MSNLAVVLLAADGLFLLTAALPIFIKKPVSFQRTGLSKTNQRKPSL
jgi:hypothetical protein